MRGAAIALAALLLPAAALAQQGETPTDRQAQTGATGAQAEPSIGVQTVPPSVVDGRQPREAGPEAPDGGPEASDAGRGGDGGGGDTGARTGRPAPNVAAQPPAPIARVLAGLRDEMRKAGEHLKAGGQRKLAMETLDASLRLAEFGTRAYGLTASQRRPFDAALESVKAARHEVQMGRPGDAAAILSRGADGESADLSGAEASLPRSLLSKADGLKLLNAAGKKLGEIEDFRGEGEGLFAEVAHSGFVGLGEKTTLVPVGALLGAENFVVLPDDISPEAFKDMDVFAR